MNDEILIIKLTESEINLITLLLEQAGTMEDENGQPAFELLHDIMEQTARQDDWDLEPTDLDGRMFSVAEEDFIDHGMRAREMAKNHNAQTFGEFEVESSKSADRRAERMMKGTASPVDGSSWPLNDPIDW